MTIEKILDGLIGADVYMALYKEGIVQKTTIENGLLYFEISFSRNTFAGENKKILYDPTIVFFDNLEDQEMVDELLLAIKEINSLKEKYRYFSKSYELVKINYKINNEIKKVQILSEIEISDKEYKILLEYFQTFYIPLSPEINPSLSVFMMQFWMKKFGCVMGGFWENFEKEIGNPRYKKSWFLNTFKNTILHYTNLYYFNDNNIDQVVENIKLHSFVLNSSMMEYMDFVKTFYEITLRKDIFIFNQSVINGLQNSLRKTQDEDDITLEDSLHVSKKYALLKCTKRAIANLKPETLNKFFFYTLQCFDDYRCNNGRIADSNNRFDIYFKEYLTKNNKKVIIDNTVLVHRRKYNSKPYLKYFPNSEEFKLLIPRQSFSSDDIDESLDDVTVLVRNNNKIFTAKTRVYESFESFMFEEKELKFSVDNIFSDFEIRYEPISILDTKIKPSKFRIFDEKWNEIKKLKEGNLYILLPEGTLITEFNREDLNCEPYIISNKNYMCYSLNVNKDSKYIIDGAILEMSNESIDICFDHEITSMNFYDYKNNEIKATREHPEIVLNIYNDEIRTGIISVNDFKIKLREIDKNQIYNLGNGKSQLVIPLTDFISNDRDYYLVSFDSKRNNKRTIAEYLLLPFFNIRFEKLRYIYEKNGDNATWFSIKHVGMDIDKNVDYECIESNEAFSKFKLFLSNAINRIKININIGNKAFSVIRKIGMVRMGFSIDKLSFEVPKAFWYSDMPSNLYIEFPGCHYLLAYLNKRQKVGNEYSYCDLLKSDGCLCEKDIYRVDISSFNKAIDKFESPYNERDYFLRLVYEDNKIRKVNNYIRIQRVNHIFPFYPQLYQLGNSLITSLKTNEGKGKIKFSVISNGQIFLPNSIIDGKYYFDDCDLTKSNTLIVEMVEEDFFNKKLTKICQYTYMPPFDYNDLENKRVKIKDIEINNTKINSSVLEMKLYVKERINNNSYKANIFCCRIKKYFSCRIIVINNKISCLFDEVMYYDHFRATLTNTFLGTTITKYIGKSLSIAIEEKEIKELFKEKR